MKLFKNNILPTPRMTQKKGLLIGIVILAIICLAFGGYQIYRYPAMFRNLSDKSLDDSKTDEVKTDILNKEETKILVAYFSYSGTTRNIATALSEKLDADLFEIVPKESYSNVYTESNREIRHNEKPELTDGVENMDDYDIVFVGYPVWWQATPAPVNTFLESYDLTGKLIIPFCTSGESDISETMPTFLNSCNNLAVYGQKRLNGTNQIDEWIAELGILQNSEPSASFPEAIQNTGSSVVGLESLPVYDYEQHEIEVTNNGQKIYGIAYIPNTGEEKVPLVISAHGLGGSYQSNLAYAEQLASHGMATYSFDFRGGGGNRSDGSTTEMSVMTEVSDIEAILDAASGWDFVDTQRIVLLGTSQGGIVSAIAAARHTNEVAGAILMYPAFVVHDDIHKRFSSLDEVPSVYQFNWITAGRPYVEDMWDYDVYTEIGNYTKKVLLMHGNEDGIVPISYSDRAADVYPDVEYYVIDGAGHGFSGNAFDEAVNHIFNYLQEIEIINRNDK